MDNALSSKEQAAKDKKPEKGRSKKLQPDNVEMEDSTGDLPSSTTEAEKELTPDSTHEAKDTQCRICGFSAKCPRSLKVHVARKHGKSTDNTAKHSEKMEFLTDEIEAEMETEGGPDIKQNQDSDIDTINSAASDNGLTKKLSVLDKQQTDQEEAVPTQERRTSKRTPKPKIIYSCNYCGQEFRDKSPLDLHIHRYHTKDTPLTCKYLLVTVH